MSIFWVTKIAFAIFTLPLISAIDDLSEECPGYFSNEVKLARSAMRIYCDRFEHFGGIYPNPMDIEIDDCIVEQIKDFFQNTLPNNEKCLTAKSIKCEKEDYEEEKRKVCCIVKVVRFVMEPKWYDLFEAVYSSKVYDKSCSAGILKKYEDRKKEEDKKKKDDGKKQEDIKEPEDNKKQEDPTEGPCF